MNTYRKRSRPADPFWTVFAALSILLIWPQAAHAYLDNGTITIIVQAAFATIFTLVGTSRMWWGRFTKLIGRNKTSDDESVPTPED